jgi:hypothetical protein
MYIAKAPCSYVIGWDLVVLEGSGDALVIGSWVLMTDHLRATLMRWAPLEGLNPLIAFF